MEHGITFEVCKEKVPVKAGPTSYPCWACPPCPGDDYLRASIILKGNLTTPLLLPFGSKQTASPS